MQLKGDTKTSHDSGSGSGSGAGAGANASVVKTPATVLIARPARSMTTANPVTPPGYEPTSTIITADDRSPDSSISSYTGLLTGILGVERTLSKKKQQRDGDGHAPSNGIMQTQEISVQVHDKDVDPRSLYIGYAV